MYKLEKNTRRKIIGGLTLVAAHREPGKGDVTLCCRTGPYPYRVTAEGATGQHRTWESAKREFKFLTGPNEGRWTI